MKSIIRYHRHFKLTRSKFFKITLLRIAKFRQLGSDCRFLAKCLAYSIENVQHYKFLIKVHVLFIKCEKVR
jgi:putative component of membrane protein insertase Oxa1/YidC/SpoIIIJ protein YidD